jgi:hypothetical protein
MLYRVLLFTGEILSHKRQVETMVTSTHVGVNLTTIRWWPRFYFRIFQLVYKIKDDLEDYDNPSGALGFNPVF